MKKILSIFASFFMLAVFSSCDNSVDNFEEIPQMVTLKINCSFDNVATRANGNELYTQLYNKILSKELVANEYTLKFTEKTTGDTFTLNGKFNSNETVSIKTGSYKITGSASANGEVIQDKCSIKFDTEADVTANSSTLTLRAVYDCFLLIFDKDAVKDVYIAYSSLSEKRFFETGNVYYGFSHKLYNDNSNISSQRLVVKYSNNQTFEFALKDLNPKNGEYYIFDKSTVPSSQSNLKWQSFNFTIDKMICGSL